MGNQKNYYESQLIINRVWLRFNTSSYGMLTSEKGGENFLFKTFQRAIQSFKKTKLYNYEQNN